VPGITDLTAARSRGPGGALRPHAALLAVLGLGVALYAGRYWLAWDRFVEGTLDDAIWIPLIMRWSDATLFTRDPFVPSVLPVFPAAYLGLTAPVLGASGDPGTFLLVVSSLLLLVYATGTYRLVWVVTGHRAAALLVALVSLRGNTDVSGTGWGVFLGTAPPRSFLFAATPWIVAGLVRAGRARWRLALTGGLLGLLGNIHPLSAGHLYLLAATGIAVRGAPGRLRGVAGLSLGFGAGMLPYLTQWLMRADVSALPMEILRFRAAPQTFPPLAAVLEGLLVTYVLVTVLAGAGWWCARRRGDGERAALMAWLGLSALAWAAIGPPVAYVVPRLFAVHLLRMSGYVFLFALVLTGFVLRELLVAPGRGRTVAASVLAAALFLTAGGGRVGEVREWLTGERLRARAAVLGADVLPKTYGMPDKPAFLELAAWARTQTPPDALFLGPPDAFPSFRVYARRALFVTFKDGAVTVFSGRLARSWYDRFRAAVELYQRFRRDDVVAFARRHGIRYVIRLRSPAGPADLPVVYENRAFQVYEISAR